jgi:phage shock protein E
MLRSMLRLPAVLALLAGFACGSSAAPGADSIVEKIRAGATIIDVRSTQEFASGAYAGALNIPVQELENRLAEAGPRDRPVVLYCASGVRSERARLILLSAGFKEVYNAGGLRNMPQL